MRHADVRKTFYEIAGENRSEDGQYDFACLEKIHEGTADGTSLLHGYCTYFAKALHEAFGYDTFAIYDGYELIHCFCKDGDDYVDVRGRTADYRLFISEFEDFVDAEKSIENIRWCDVKDVSMPEDTGDEEDRYMIDAWGLAQRMILEYPENYTRNMDSSRARLIERIDQPEQERTLYMVDMGDGRVVRAVRMYFPTLSSPQKTLFVLNDGVDEMEVWKAVKESSPPTDFATAVFERRCHGSYAAVKDTCYSLEQAKYLAEKLWAETREKDKWLTFRICVYCGAENKVFQDWLSEEVA